MQKSAFKSKTLWFNLLVGVGVACEYALNLLPDDGKAAQIVVIVASIANMFLRFATHRPVALVPSVDPTDPD